MWRRVLLAVVLVLVPVSLLAYGLRSDPSVVPSPLVDRFAPEFALAPLGGGPDVRLGDFRGRVLVLNFWASWCVPCREEAPELEALWTRYRGTSVTVLGVNIQDREDAARAFLAEMRTTFPNVVDAKGATSIAYGIYGVPETFVIDASGRIRYRHVGPVVAGALAQRISSVLVASGS